METLERLTRARIQIQLKNPFFSYMSLFLKFKQREDCKTAGVDFEGNFYYSDEFFKTLNDREVEGVVIHEILHLVLLHLTRKGSRNHELFNVATDLCINWIIQENNFQLPSGCLLPERNGSFEKMGLNLKDIHKKSAEEVYDEIIKQLPPKQKGKQSQEGEMNEDSQDVTQRGFDKHYYKEGLTEQEKKKAEKEWIDKINEGMTMAKMRGQIPAGLERAIGDLHSEKINWRALLNEYITQQIPYNYCYSKPHKRSVSIGEYTPHQLKEKIEIAVCLDLSGSVGKEEYTNFLSEIIGIARAYQERIDIHFYSHDTDAYYGGLVRNGNIEKIKNIELKGGGGTSHKAVMDMIQKERRDCKMVIFFTDAYSDLQDIEFSKYDYSKIFVIQNGSDECIKNKRCKIIKMENVK